MTQLGKFVCALALCLMWLATSAYAQDTRIDTSLAVEINGIKQWITVKGTRVSNPVLLFLHGGPGNSVMGYADKFTGALQNQFVVVNWDQRESGKTAALNKSDKALTVSVMEADALVLVNYLRERFSQEKIYLVGHSWGGFLGMMMALHYPELLNGYVAVCPMIHQVESERFSLNWMLDKAKTNGNKKALAELAQVHIPFESGEQLYYHRAWLQQLMGNKAPAKDFVETWAKKWLSLFNEASVVNFFKTAPELKCPVYFFVGRKDYQTYSKLTSDYYNVVLAPKKKIVWFEDAGHNLNSREPEKFQEAIVAAFLSDK